jgi:hypothetical protein
VSTRKIKKIRAIRVSAIREQLFGLANLARSGRFFPADPGNEQLFGLSSPEIQNPDPDPIQNPECHLSSSNPDPEQLFGLSSLPQIPIIDPITRTS